MGSSQSQKMIIKLRDATIADLQRRRPMAEIQKANNVRLRRDPRRGECAPVLTQQACPS